MFSQTVGFGSNGLTAHSRDGPKFNLRWFWLPAAAKAVSHSTRMSVREICWTATRRSGNRATEEHPPR